MIFLLTCTTILPSAEYIKIVAWLGGQGGHVPPGPGRRVKRERRNEKVKF